MRVPFTALAAIVLAASTAYAGKNDDTLNAAFETEVTTLDYFKESGRPGIVVGRQIFDSLVDKDLKTGEFKPALASSYKQVDDKTIDFVIREGVKFHDGKILSVDDVVYTLNLVADGKYVRFTALTKWIDRAEALDGSTVRLHMKVPTPMALEFLAGNIPIYQKAFHEAGDAEAISRKPIGTGPYRVTEVVPGVRYALERFDDYYGKGVKTVPAIKNLVIRILPEANTQYAELLNGKLDWVWKVPPTEAAKLTRNSKLEAQDIDIIRFGFLQFNPGHDGGKSPLANVKVRQAMSLAIDREKIIKALIKGSAKPISTPCNPLQTGCYSDGDKPEYNVDKAKNLLAEAGYPDGFSAELLASSAVPSANVQAITGDLAKIGVRLNINVQQAAAATSQWRAGGFGVRIYDWGGYGVADVGLTIPIFFGGAGDDKANDKEITDLVAKAEQTVDKQIRSDLYKAVVKKVKEQAYFAPLWSTSYTMVTNKDLSISPGYDEFVPFSNAKWN